MMSRCCALDQLHIVDKFDPEKITVDEDVKAEVARMDKVSVNTNPSPWMDPATLGLKVCSLNTLSLRKHMEDVRTDPVLLKSDVLCLMETWLEEGEEEDERYQLEGFRGLFNSVGRGKGQAVYVKRELEIRGIVNFAEPNIQMMKIEMESLDVIAVYRSKEEPLFTAKHQLQNLIHPEKDTMVIGDINYGANEDNDFSRYLAREGFTQLVKLPTHIRGGINICFIAVNYSKNYSNESFEITPILSGIIDQAHLRTSATKLTAQVETYSHYYSDHDSVTVVLENRAES